jgi:serine/threonine-protein phosphatase Stp1
MTGVYGKLPSYGDFVRRELPASFVNPWDAWLQAGLAGAREALGLSFEAMWAAAPAWRFRLPAGACGPAPVAGVMVVSRDSVGRSFPLTVAAELSEFALPPDEDWYARLEYAAVSGRDHGDTADTLVALLPPATPGQSLAFGDDVPAVGWWTASGRRLRFAALPTPAQFRTLLETGSGRLMARGVTHQGTVRKRNEDAFVDRGDIGLWAVADGAGGHGAGDVASAAVAAALSDLPPGLSAAEVLAQVRMRLNAVHADLQCRAAEATNGEIPATTVVVLMARGEHFACLWAGDSRAYMLRDHELCQITHDHSLVQEMVEAGELAPEDAEHHPQANIITRAIGAPDALELDKVSGRISAGDVLLLCTDGLFKALPEREIAQVLASGGGPEMLIDEALRQGARDNVTALVVEFQP